jgi:N-acetylglucosamine kinase-like BadF-type ATPase
MYKAMQVISHEWACRGPKTALAQVLIDHVGAKGLDDLIEGYCQGRFSGIVEAPAAELVFETAHTGDAAAQDIIRWAGVELGEMANGVIRKLGFEDLAFDVVLSGSMFEGGQMLIDPMEETILDVAPHARLVRLEVPPVIGAVLIGMEQGGLMPTAEIRAELKKTVSSVL